MNNSKLMSLIYALMEGPWVAPPGKGGTTSEAPPGVPRTTRRLRSQVQSLGEGKSGFFIPGMSLESILFFSQSAQAFSRDLKCVIGLNVLRQDSVESPPRAAKNRAALNCAPRRGGPATCVLCRVVPSRGLRHPLVWSPPLILQTRSRSKDLPGWPSHLASPKKGPAGTDPRALGVSSPQGHCCFGVG